MGFPSALFVVQGAAPPQLEHCECAICHDVVEDAALCQQGHTCARAAVLRGRLCLRSCCMR
jgi:hypothetical protein